MGIRELDKKTAEQIAAGEVIENPASVVKELVENALDAGATKIGVEIENGGKSYIAVTDNGIGIKAGEIPLAFKRFATSKLEVLDDLKDLSSLGFRGEALPSIAAVARVKMTTRTESAFSGVQITLAGGDIIKQEEAGAPHGTRVEVTDLFYNTPGRLKFLRSGSVESARISTLLSEMALARPGTAFSLKSAKRSLFSSSGDGVLLHVIASLYGNDTAEAMIEIGRRDKDSGSSLTGYTSAPYLTKSSRRWITLVVNGRLIKNPMMIYSLERAYGDLLTKQRHPLSILFLEISPGLIDVNVHPAKVEIRFQEPESIKKLIYRSVKIALQDTRKLPDWPEKNLISDHPSKKPDPRAESRLFNQAADFKAVSMQYEKDNISPGLEAKETELDSETEHAPETCRLIGQYLKSYLVAQKGENLLLIDQHAAHERITYHQLQKMDSGSGQEEKSQLVMPVTLNFPAIWRNKIPKLLPIINTLGFDLEPLGEDSYVLRSVPFMISENASSSQLYDLFEELITADYRSESEYRETILKTIACHRSIKAKQPLTRDEMEALLRKWEKTPHAQYCPHGRPTVISFNRNQLDRSFHRKGN
ncbi:MAG: DNA mismatch repair endonuclease MutL [Bacillota bacterium]